MKIIDEPLLAEFRNAPGCDWCFRDRRQAGALQAHHLRCRGMNGGSRLDIRINLASVCAVPCHAEVQGSRVATAELLEIVARREGTTAEEITDAINRLLNHPKHLPLPPELQRFVRAA